MLTTISCLIALVCLNPKHTEETQLTCIDIYINKIQTKQDIKKYFTIEDINKCP